MRRFIEGAIPGLAATLLLSACIYLRDVPEPSDAGGLSADVGISTEKATAAERIAPGRCVRKQKAARLEDCVICRAMYGNGWRMNITITTKEHQTTALLGLRDLMNPVWFGAARGFLVPIVGLSAARAAIGTFLSSGASTSGSVLGALSLLAK